jgi:penicillin-binding protein 1B
MPGALEVTQPTAARQDCPLFQTREGRILAASLVGVSVLYIFILLFNYVKFARIVEQRLKAGPFSDTIDIFAAPHTVAVGDVMTLTEAATLLRNSGYATAHGNPGGWINVRRNALDIFPGPNSYPASKPGILEFSSGKISRIISPEDNTARKEYTLEPQLIANLSVHREKRRLAAFDDIPPSLMHAVLSAEDKHFFRHSGLDLFRILKAAYVDAKDGSKKQGASTLSMQLARSFWLEPGKHWKRKLAELLITTYLEDRLSKQQIFEDYANEVYLGRHGTFGIRGFGEGARAYFGKELSQLSNAEAALLAGLVQRPSYYNPYRHPERARARRAIVLALMRQNGYLTDAEYREAVNSPLEISARRSDALASPYFVDLINDETLVKLDDQGKQARYIYTTLDLDLQQAAEEAVRTGIENVDQQLRKRRSREAIPAGQPQVALIALDPHTGEVKALVGGRNYGASQLNHVVAMRQPGSVFKPFVYAAALETGIRGGQRVFTPASVVSDEPTTFYFGNKAYQPDNFKHEFMGDVTLRTALAHSLNVATVRLAQEVGYANVVSMAHRAGLNESIKATPALALGAYETTPLEIAGAYTTFANQGVRVSPVTVSLVRASDGTVLREQRRDARTVLDPRVAYILVSIMQDVVRSGTGASVRSRGFTLPAAGKTGTSRDGWFAGFTSELLCVVWVGFDDNRELRLEGARSALPIWTEFMKRAAQFRAYRDAKAFQAAAGIKAAEVCAESGQLASPFCPNVRSEVFIDGTEPTVQCELHNPNIAMSRNGTGLMAHRK